MLKLECSALQLHYPKEKGLTKAYKMLACVRDFIFLFFGRKNCAISEIETTFRQPFHAQSIQYQRKKIYMKKFSPWKVNFTFEILKDYNLRLTFKDLH